MWSKITRQDYERHGGRYASDMTDHEWAMPPNDFPPPSTVRRYIYDWRACGPLESISHHLVAAAREREGREASARAGLIDSQSVKTTESGGVRDYDAGKKIKRRKRHIITDTLGLLVGLVVHGANIQDRDGAPGVLKSIRHGFSAQGKAARCPLGGLVDQAEPAIVQKADKAAPVPDRIIHRLGDGRGSRQTNAFLGRPGFQFRHQRCAFIPPRLQALRRLRRFAAMYPGRKQQSSLNFSVSPS